MQAYRKIISLDFDGVLHKFNSPWESHEKIVDSPNTGAIEWLHGLLQDTRFSVCIHSSRCNKPEGIAAMMKWLVRYGLPRSLLDKIEFAERKPPSHVLIDDRAIQFRGSWPSYDEIANFKPWHAKLTPERRPSTNNINYDETESEGEAALIWQREHRCLTCLHAPVCAVAVAIKQLNVFTAVSRCVGHIESFMPEIE
jgi:hypothetical protein